MESEMIQPIVIRHDLNGITTLTLNRPDQMNALSERMITALQTQLDAIAQDESVRVVVLSGAGRAFCAGHDLKEIMANRTEKFINSLFQRCSNLMLTIHNIPQPVIAKVQGLATAAGCQLVASCDLAVASKEARFATSGIKYGLFCATPAVPLSRNVLRKQAFEMLFTGEFISANKALEIGLINSVVQTDQLDPCVIDLASSIIAKPRRVVAAGKKLFYRQLPLSLEDAYPIASHCLVENMLGDDAAEGVTAFIEKRDPQWLK